MFLVLAGNRRAQLLIVVVVVVELLSIFVIQVREKFIIVSARLCFGLLSVILV